jgi:hypothetical protein
VTRPYDQDVDDDADILRPFLDRPRRLLEAWRRAGKHNIGLAIGKGPLECPTCGTPWPCRASKAKA